MPPRWVRNQPLSTRDGWKVFESCPPFANLCSRPLHTAPRRWQTRCPISWTECLPAPPTRHLVASTPWSLGRSLLKTSPHPETTAHLGPRRLTVSPACLQRPKSPVHAHRSRPLGPAGSSCVTSRAVLPHGRCPSVSHGASGPPCSLLSPVKGRLGELRSWWPEPWDTVTSGR